MRLNREETGFSLWLLDWFSSVLGIRHMSVTEQTALHLRDWSRCSTCRNALLLFGCNQRSSFEKSFGPAAKMSSFLELETSKCEMNIQSCQGRLLVLWLCGQVVPWFAYFDRKRLEGRKNDNIQHQLYKISLSDLSLDSNWMTKERRHCHLNRPIEMARFHLAGVVVVWDDPHV